MSKLDLMEELASQPMALNDKCSWMAGDGLNVVHNQEKVGGGGGWEKVVEGVGRGIGEVGVMKRWYRWEEWVEELNKRDGGVRWVKGGGGGGEKNGWEEWVRRMGG